LCLAKAERHAYEDVDAEVAALTAEAEMGEDDWMSTLPKGYLDAVRRNEKLPVFSESDAGVSVSYISQLITIVSHLF
jgi:hypothetical protein